MLGSLYDRFRLAEALFEQRDHRTAAKVLEAVLTEADDDPALHHGLQDAKLLLARVYYHSARLGRAEQILRPLVDADPTDAYAALLLGRTLQRSSRHEEAARLLARAEALGLTP